MEMFLKFLVYARYPSRRQNSYLEMFLLDMQTTDILF